MISIIESFLWAIATVMIIYSGIYFSIKLKFIQFNFKEMFKNLFYKSNNISLFKSLLIVLGGRIGVGSIAGTILAINLGGIGTVFWMVLIGIISSVNTFGETVLGVKYKEKDQDDLNKGGPCYYIKNGLKKYKLSLVYALVMLVTYIVGVLSIQANTIRTALTSVFNINPFYISLFIAFLSLFIISGGIKKISKVINFIVPIMLLLYVIISCLIIFKNYSEISDILVTIFFEAFNFKSLGIGVLTALIIGVQRGIFSNEAGLGTGAIASSIVKVDFSARQGYVQMLGIYITTILICLTTALVYLSSGLENQNIVNGIEHAQKAYIYHLGGFGNIFLIVIIVLFASSTVLSGYYDGETNYKRIFGANTKILKVISFFVIFIGSLVKADYIWKFINIFTAIMAIINIYSIYKLKKEVIYELDIYKKSN